MARKKPMHVLTGTGDGGTTALLGGGRVPKDDARIEACGTLDEASSALGLARATTASPLVAEIVAELQRGLYRLGAELATGPGDAGRYGAVGESDVGALEARMAELEALTAMPKGFVLPGAVTASAALDLARTVVRRAERRCVTLSRQGAVANPEVLRYLNRMSLLLFVLARHEEALAGTLAEPAREDRAGP